MNFSGRGRLEHEPGKQPPCAAAPVSGRALDMETEVEERAALLLGGGQCGHGPRPLSGQYQAHTLLALFSVGS
ncbi:hypothetical protein [Streptomyces xiaopingdaonensis]|uniref:hypothetical protein n=1 Tax=Streptomyces xiaopingdaonensis TaxID=1565415 RepID=UPI000372FCD6|nr:hypothetical protein [Streptomyces xiaopingdaonensis]